MKIISREINYKNIKQETVKTNLFYLTFSSFKEIKDKINNEFVDIVSADPEYDLKPMKLEVKNFLAHKTDEQKHGAVAEFFAHIVLRELGYIQQCLFLNLEDNSMKKGFDGLYIFDSSFWIMESKSAITNKVHRDKIHEALDCISDSIEGRTSNNPWKNAVNHVLCMENSKRDESIKKRIKRLSKDYLGNKFHKANEFNLIPVSTLFLSNVQTIDDMVKDINALLLNSIYKNIVVVCLDNYIYDEFLEYLEE